MRNMRELHNKDVYDIKEDSKDRFRRNEEKIKTLYRNRDGIAWAIISIVLFAGISFLIYQNVR